MVIALSSCGGTDAPPDANAVTWSVTLDGVELCPLGWDGTLEALASAGQIQLGHVDVTVSPLVCDAGAGNLNRLYFRPVPTVGSTAPCVEFGVVKDASSSACSTDEQSTVMPTGTLTVSGTEGAYTVSGSCSCPASSSNPATMITFAHVPMTVK
jgi:hypothetical protein